MMSHRFARRLVSLMTALFLLPAAGALALERAPLHDYDGDKKADLAAFEPATGNWAIRKSSTNTIVKFNWGSAALLPVPGDYDADGKTDAAVFDPTTGDWFAMQSRVGSTLKIRVGKVGDVAIPGDYDGDGYTDFAAFTPSNGLWTIRFSSTRKTYREYFGSASSKPVPADYDGDGVTDIATYLPKKGNWFIEKSSDFEITFQNWGWSDASPVPADYDGDGKADIAVYQPSSGSWFILQSRDGKQALKKLGGSKSIPAPADYDGDGKADVAVYDAAKTNWLILQSSTGSTKTQSVGTAKSMPASGQLWNYYRNIANAAPPAATNKTPSTKTPDALDISKLIMLNHTDTKPQKISSTRKLSKSDVNGGCVEFAFETLGWTTLTGSNGKTIDGGCYIFWVENGQTVGGLFDWHGYKQTRKTLSNIPPGSKGNGILGGRVPPKGSTTYYCLINREKTARTNVQKSTTPWK